MWTRHLLRGRPGAGRVTMQATLLRGYSWIPRQRKSKKPQLIIEEDVATNKVANCVSDLRHYLKTTEVPQTLRQKLLRTKLMELVNDAPDLSDATVSGAINATVMQFYRSELDLLEAEDLQLIFNRSVQSLLAAEKPSVPQYVAKLAQTFSASDEHIPTTVLVNVLRLGSLTTRDFAVSLRYVARSQKSRLPYDFTQAVLQQLQGELDLAKFEAFLAVGEKDALLIDSNFCGALMDYVEGLFAETNPNVHEYKNLERSVHRIQLIATETIEQSFSKVDTETKLKLLKFKADLNSVAATASDRDQIGYMLLVLNEEGSSDDYEMAKGALFKQNLSDEALAENLIMELAKHGYAAMSTLVNDFIIADDVKFSDEIRLRASLIKCFAEEKAPAEAYAAAKEIFSLHLEEASTLDIIVETAMASPIEPIEFINKLKNDLESEYDPSVQAFKSIIDRAILLGNADYAWATFEQSLKYGNVHWNHTFDPSVNFTLSNLVTIVAQKGTDITSIFPKFRKVKQHMTSSCNADALQAMAQKMLAEECVGDVIEMLKRELPKIDKDSVQRIGVNAPYAVSHRQLFDCLHDFVLSYRNEETFETNWVLYGELHKYFHVPYETYMPVLKFFCDVDRLNAALVIFRKMKMLNEQHGSKVTNLPPLREMYMYLLQVFGDRLYEDGVIEVHEFLKMDLNVPTQDIQLQNSVLNAYSNLQNVGKVRDLFLSITSNAKQSGGINEETAQIMIKTYTYSDMLYVKKFWDNLSQFGVFPNYAVFKQYVIAHVYHGKIEEAVQLVEEIDDYNLEFSPDLLLSMHNYCLDPKKQEMVIDWAAQNHREAWDKLQQSGLLRKASQYAPDSNLLTSGD